MKSRWLVCALFAYTGFVQASGNGALVSLQQALGKTIVVTSPQEIRYCPDNTCEIFSVKDALASSELPGFVFLYLYHRSTYIYLSKSYDGSAPFRVTAKAVEANLRQEAETFCRELQKTPACILDGMGKKLGVVVNFGRYDEGEFRTLCKPGDSCITQPPSKPEVSRLAPPGPPPAFPPSMPPPERLPD